MDAGSSCHAGLGFPEGPVALPDGSIAFVDLLHQKIRAVKDGRLREICTLQGSPNGMRLGPDGALYVATMAASRRISMEDLNFAEPQISGPNPAPHARRHASSDFAADLPGEAPWRPNDLVFSPEGDIVFTDPQNWEVLGARSDPPYHGGQLLAADARRQGEAACHDDRVSQRAGFPSGRLAAGRHHDGTSRCAFRLE